MVRGPDALDRRILAIAAPAFAALVTEPLMLLTDTIVVGHLGTPQLAGLAVAGTLLTTVVGLCIFLAYGTTAAVARQHGAGEEARSSATAVAGLWLAALIGVTTGVVLAVAARPLTSLLASSPEVAEHARTYLVIGCAGLPGLLLVLAATGALRGVLDLRTPLLVAVVANVANAALTIVLVHRVGLGLAGAAIGTVAAQSAAAAWLVGVVVVRARRTGAPLAPRWSGVLTAALDGVPLLIRTVTLRASLLLATAVAATFGDAPLAAHQVAVSIVSLLAFALDAVAIAGQTLTGRSLGAGDVELTRRLTDRMVAWGIGGGLVLGAVLLASSTVLPKAFSGDPDVRTALVGTLVVIALLQPLSGVVFVLDGVLIGAGDGRYLARAGVVTLVVYAPCAVAVGALDAGLTWLWVAYGVFILGRLVTLERRRRGTAWIVVGA